VANAGIFTTLTTTGLGTFNSVNLPNLNPNELVGTDGSGNLISATAVSGVIPPTPSTVVQRDADANVFARNFVPQTTEIVTTGGTTTLTTSSIADILFIGGAGQTLVMPKADDYPNKGIVFEVNNKSTGTISVQDFTTASLTSLAAGASVKIILLDNTSPGGQWDIHAHVPAGNTWGSGGLVTSGGVSASGFVENGVMQFPNLLPNDLLALNGQNEVIGISFSNPPSVDPDPDTLGLRDGGGQFYATNMRPTVTQVVTTGGTLPVSSGNVAQYQFTGVLGHAVQLPDATTCVPGQEWSFSNRSTGLVQVTNLALTVIGNCPSGGRVLVTNLTNATTNGTWSIRPLGADGAEWGTAGLKLTTTSPNQTLVTNGTGHITSTTAGGGPVIKSASVNIEWARILVGTTYMARAYSGSSWGGKKFNQGAPASVGDSIEMDFNLSPGTYNMEFFYLAGTNTGIIEVYIDNVSKATFNTYYSSSAAKYEKKTGIVVTGGTDHVLKWIVTGTSGSDYLIYGCSFEFYL